MSKLPHIKYTIKDLERLSGVKAHTIRMWEQRYNLLQPERTATNIRYYSGNDLRKLLNVSVLNQKGIKISRIIQMSAQEVHAKIEELSTDFCDQQTQVEGLIVAMIDLDETRFEHILAGCTKELGFEETMLQVIYPFFTKVGVLWQTGSILPAQEHFISNLVRQKLIVAIDALPHQKKNNAKKFVLFLPEGELHELGLLFHAYLIKKAGHHAIYLGQSVPVTDLQAVLSLHNPNVCVTSLLTYSAADEIEDTLHRIVEVTGSTPVWLISNFRENAAVGLPKTVQPYGQLAEFKAQL